MAIKADRQDEIFASVKIAFELKYGFAGARLKKDLKNLIKMREEQMLARARQEILDKIEGLEPPQIAMIKDMMR